MSAANSIARQIHLAIFQRLSSNDSQLITNTKSDIECFLRMRAREERLIYPVSAPALAEVAPLVTVGGVPLYLADFERDEDLRHVLMTRLRELQPTAHFQEQRA